MFDAYTDHARVLISDANKEAKTASSGTTAEFARLADLETWWQGHAAWTDAHRPSGTVKMWGWFEEQR